MGTRLKPITDAIPKSMVKVGGIPVIDQIIFHIKKFGITEIMVNTGYKGDQIHAHLGNQVTYFHDPFLTLTADETVETVSPWFYGDHMLVVNGDTLTDLDIKKMFDASRGDSIRFMDPKKSDVYGGYTIYTPKLGGIGWSERMWDYIPQDTHFWDVGTWTGLKKARAIYERK